MIRLLVGLTGGMASGKSTVTRMLAAAGCHVIDADRIVADLYQAGADAARAVAEIAGPQVLDDAGAVDHAALAQRLFHDAPLRTAIEEAVHPMVRERFESLAEQSDAAIIVLEATLLVEAGYKPAFDLVVTVEADGGERLRRAIGRGLAEAQARDRLVAQGDGAERRGGADVVLENDGSLEDLQSAVDELVESLERRLAAKRSAETEA